VIFTNRMQNRPFVSSDVIEFVKDLLLTTDKDITIVWDGAMIHRSKMVKDFLCTLAPDRLKLVRFPAYSPDLNPIEFIWSYLKWGELKNECFLTIDDLSYAVHMSLLKLKSNPELVRKFFNGVDLLKEANRKFEIYA